MEGTILGVHLQALCKVTIQRELYHSGSVDQHAICNVDSGGPRNRAFMWAKIPDHKKHFAG